MLPARAAERMAAVAAGLSSAPTPSWWLEHAGGTDPSGTADPPPVPEAADFVVVGGGLSGVSTAYWLNKLGHSCVLIEGRGLAGGASGRNGGVLSGGSEFHKANIEMLKGIMEEHGGFEDFEYRLGGYLRIAFEGSDEAKEYAEAELDADRQELWGAERCAAELQTDTVDGLKIACGIFGKTSGHFWPAKMVHAIAAGATNTTFCVGTHALSLEPAAADGSGVVLQTDRGAIRCKRVAVCTNGWSPRLLPELAQVLYPVRNGVIMTAPVNAWSWEGSVSIGDGPEEIYAMRRPDGRICIGGARRRDPSCSWFTSEWQGPEEQPGSDDDSTIVAPVAARLREFLGQLIGEEELVVESEWTGVLGFTLDGKPLAGAMPGEAHGGRVYVGAGYCGHGMPTCSGVGKALAQQMAGAEGHDVSSIAACDTATIEEYVRSLDPGRFSQLSGAAAAAAVATAAVQPEPEK